MKRETLKALGLNDDQINAIMASNGEDIEAERKKTNAANASLAEARQEPETLKASGPSAADLQTKLDDLQKKYDTDTAALQDQITKRDYAEAVSAAITGASLKFSSKGAESAFRAALAEKELKLKDGKLEGFDDFVKAQKEADPASFAPDKPAPTITKQTGVGPKPDNGESANVAKAKEMGKARAEAAKANNDVFSQYSILKGE